MNKFFSYLMCAFALTCVVACNVDTDEPQAGKKVSISASFEDYTATRMTLNGYKPTWEAGDAITINGYTFTTTEGGADASFVSAEAINIELGTALYATYGDMSVAASQVARVGNMPQGTPAYANGVLAEATTLSFKNPAALLKFTTEVEGDITFKAVGGESLAGKFSAEGGDLTEGSATVTLTGCESGKSYYVAVAPATLTQGIEIVCGTSTLQTGAVGQKIEGSKIYDLGTLKTATPDPDPTPDPKPEPDPTPDPETQTVYLVPGVWAVDGAWFSVHAWGEGIDVDARMTDNDADGIYECEISTSMTGIIFCRMNPAYSEFSWDYVWDQTADLTIGVAPANYYHVTDWKKGEWGEKPAPIVWSLAGTFNSWGDTIMTETTTTNLFVAKGISLSAGSKFKVKDSTTWATSYGGGITNLEANKWMKAYSNGADIDIAKSGTYDVYFEYKANAEYCKIYLIEANGDYTAATEQTENGTLVLPKATTRTEEYSEGVWQW